MPNNIENKKYQIKDKVRRSEVMLERIEDKIDLLIENQNGMKENFNSRFDSIESKVSKLVTDADVIKLDVVVIRDGLKKKADIGETTALRRRVMALEGSK